MTATGSHRTAREMFPGAFGVPAGAPAGCAPDGLPGHGPALSLTPRARRTARRAAVRCALPPWHRGCRAPARRVRGRRVRYHIGSEPGQTNGMRWRRGPVR
ncbi:tryptophan biosynthesis modulator TrpM [Streptomyces sp. NPDC059080]|uniref:tryptophan biosynthesis modulator TrpM n=1 Tax=Streptomyces sp. NPDC059080 TaxID=3346718 RepID=UPI00368BFCDE